MRLGFLLALLIVGAGPQDEADRAPSDLALLPGGRWAVVANRASGSASLVDLDEGRVAAEQPSGAEPWAVDVSADGRVAAASNRRDGTIRVFSTAPPALAAGAAIPVGDEPRGLALSDDGKRAWVALAGEDAVVEVDLAAGQITARASVGREPWSLVRRGGKLAVGNSRSGDVTILQTAPLKVLRTEALPGRARSLRNLGVSPDGRWVYVPHLADGLGPTTQRGIEEGKVLMNRLGRVPLDSGPAESMAFDVKGFASGDLEAAAAGPDGRLAVLSGGVRAIFLLKGALPFTPKPAETVDAALAKDKARFVRNGLRGRPLALRWRANGRELVVANNLRNAVQIVNAADGEIAREIPLGGPKTPASDARKGEAIFHDAMRSWHEWFSCATCHPGGHSNGGLYDTFNDGKAGNPKSVLSLRGVAKTGPWTWHGANAELGESMQGSFTRTMSRNPILREELAQVLAYLATIDFAPPGRHDRERAKRGEEVFKAKGCAECHPAPLYTDKGKYVTGLESKDDAYKGFNPPTLRGVARRGPWLHDGRAATLREVVEKHHKPSQLGGAADCTPAELDELLEFLKSL
jgi:DNA-binding beta-propeller fold protein YncE